MEYLFSLLEKATDIKETQLNRFKQCVDGNARLINDTLQNAIEVTKNIEEVEEKFKQVCTICYFLNKIV